MELWSTNFDVEAEQTSGGLESETPESYVERVHLSMKTISLRGIP